MTWKSFREESFRLTEDGVQKLVPYIVEQYKLAQRSIDAELKTVYAEILSGVKPEDYYNTMLKYNRLSSLLDNVTRQYIKFSKQAGLFVGRAGELSASNNFYQSQFSTNWLVPGIDFALIPNDLIQISVYSSVEAFKRYEASILKKIYGSGSKYFPQAGTLSEFLVSHRIKEVEQIQRSITQGLIQGKSYTYTSNTIKDVIGRFLVKDGIENTTGAIANSLRIVRTESARIMSDAADMNTEYARSEGVEIVRVWLASLDMRTRPVHARLDNKPENEDGIWQTSAGDTRGVGRFGSIGQNINCRCTTYESVNGSEPSIRRGRNPVTGENEVFSFKDFEQWAKDNNVTKNKFGQLVAKNT